ncbi:MAG: glycine zipper 2TM domain-containing protein [Ostreibacterium sp.]
MKKLMNILLFAILVASAGCISTGQKIDYNKVAMIQKNITTEADIRTMFGEPVTTQTNMKQGLRILTYGYNNNDNAKKVVGGVAGAVAGGVLGNQIGGGLGNDITTGLGALVGGVLANNLITSREEDQYLKVIIGLKSGKVVDFNYTESKGRSQKLGVTSGVSPL